MDYVQLVILAAGHSRRFGALKQLAPVGPNGEAIMDYTARHAEASGIESVVLVVRDEIRDEIADHVRTYWPQSLDVDLICQAGIPGTAQAVLSAAPAVDGPFAIANADDLYSIGAIEMLAYHFREDLKADRAHTAISSRHVLIAYELIRTVLTARPVTRGFIQTSSDRRLLDILEHTVLLRPDGHFDAWPLVGDHSSRLCEGSESVSMNLWGFHQRMFDHLRDAIARFNPREASRPELLLPEVVADLTQRGADEVHVVSTTAHCIGITHQEDLDVVRDEIALNSSGTHLQIQLD